MNHRLFTIGLSIILVLSGFGLWGCQNQANTDPDRCRLIVSENLDLKEEIVRLENKLKQTEEHYTKQLAEQQKIIDQNKNKITALQKQLSMDMEKATEELDTFMMEQMQKITEENEKLKQQLRELQNN